MLVPGLENDPGSVVGAGGRLVPRGVERDASRPQHLVDRRRNLGLGHGARGDDRPAESGGLSRGLAQRGDGVGLQGLHLLPQYRDLGGVTPAGRGAPAGHEPGHFIPEIRHGLRELGDPPADAESLQSEVFVRGRRAICGPIHALGARHGLESGAFGPLEAVCLGGVLGGDLLRRRRLPRLERRGRLERGQGAVGLRELPAGQQSQHCQPIGWLGERLRSLHQLGRGGGGRHDPAGGGGADGRGGGRGALAVGEGGQGECRDSGANQLLHWRLLSRAPTLVGAGMGCRKKTWSRRTAKRYRVLKISRVRI